MADGLNEARAMRVAEIMNDFRTLQFHIAQHRMEPAPEEYWEEGFVVMRQCAAESQAILATHFNPGSTQGAAGDGEVERIQLQRIILDASTRRFQAHKIYLRAAAATRWANVRHQILQGARPSDCHAAALGMINDTLRSCGLINSNELQELSAITDDQVIADLRSADYRAGHWLEEDPSLNTMLSWIRSQR